MIPPDEPVKLVSETANTEPDDGLRDRVERRIMLGLTIAAAIMFVGSLTMVLLGVWFVDPRFEKTAEILTVAGAIALVLLYFVARSGEET